MIESNRDISMIVAYGSNRSIGKDGNQPFFISDDLKRFKALTTGQTIVMGRKTFEALPNGALPNRKNIVITRDSSFRADGCEIAYSIEEALNMPISSKELFIIGGGTIYSQSITYTNRLYITEVRKEFEADTFFPEIDLSKWRTINQEDKRCPKTDLTYSFIDLERI